LAMYEGTTFAYIKNQTNVNQIQWMKMNEWMNYTKTYSSTYYNHDNAIKTLRQV
jgi:hypothetical protein